MAERIIANSVLSEDSWFEGTPCWIWLGKRKVNRAGQYYGALTVREGARVRNVPAHRASVRQCVAEGRHYTPFRAAA